MVKAIPRIYSTRKRKNLAPIKNYKYNRKPFTFFFSTQSSPSPMEYKRQDQIENGGNINDNDNHGFHDLEMYDDSGPDVRSPANSRDDHELYPDMWPAHNRRSIRANTRFSNNLVMESHSRNQRIGLDDGIIKKWLVELGLGRYSPVFEIHEVDEEVLPYLTLEDLKDMGINAVGSRRKLFSAIQKLRKGLS